MPCSAHAIQLAVNTAIASTNKKETEDNIVDRDVLQIFEDCDEEEIDKNTSYAVISKSANAYQPSFTKVVSQQKNYRRNSTSENNSM